MTRHTSWPRSRLPLTPDVRARALEAAKEAFAPTLASLRVDLGIVELFEQIYVPMACWILERKREGEPLVVGINGAQGAGKTTLFNILEVILSEAFGQRVFNLRIDDLYLTRAERDRLASEVHPLLKTRGVPGTHDISLGLDLLRRLKSGSKDQIVRVPIFDKSTDERCEPSFWQEWIGGADIIIFDGWCVGAQPQPEALLIDPVNDLERLEDPEGVWRRYVNERLAADYQTLFKQLDLLIMLKVPHMEIVYDWRSQQELKLLERTALLYEDRAPNDPLRIMDPTEIYRFIAHYERITRWMLDDLAPRADLTLELNENHKVANIRLSN